MAHTPVGRWRHKTRAAVPFSQTEAGIQKDLTVHIAGGVQAQHVAPRTVRASLCSSHIPKPVTGRCVARFVHT